MDNRTTEQIAQDKVETWDAAKRALIATPEEIQARWAIVEESKRIQASLRPGTAQIIVAAHDFKSSVALARFIDMLPNARIMWGTTLFMCIEFSQ